VIFPARGVRRAVAALALALVAGPVLPAAATTTPAPGEGAGGGTGALRVTIDTLTPSTLPERGRVTVTGQVVNDSDQDWSALQVSLLTSPTPIRTVDELRAAAETRPELVLGSRLLGEGQFDDVPDLAPGESTAYRLSIPRSELQISGDAGVYWLSVHVLGTDAAGRDEIADARARTFLPLVPPPGRRQTQPSVPVSLVLPVRQQVVHRAGGSIAEPADWAALLAADGRLERLRAWADAAEGTPVSWLVDPAVLDAVDRLARGNVGYDIGPTAEEPPGSTDGPEPSPSPEESPSASGPVPLESAPASDETDAIAARAAAWLEDVRSAWSVADLLQLPYADVDVASLWRQERIDLVEEAYAAGAEALADLELPGGTPVVAPVGGLLPTPAVDAAGLSADGERVVLLDDTAADVGSSTVRTEADTRVVLSDAATATGGPGPTEALDALAVRQRLLAETAVRLPGVGLSPPEGPLVVRLPDAWDPGESSPAAFFSGLDVPWLRLTPLANAVTDRSLDRQLEAPLAYGRDARRAELAAVSVDTATAVRTAGETLVALLSANDTIGTELERGALTIVSGQARTDPGPPVSLGRATVAAAAGILGRVRIEGPEFVTMSSGTGNFAVTVVNDLDQPVRVAVQPSTGDPDLTVTAPDPLELAAGARSSLRLPARSDGFGVTTVTLTPTTVDGQTLPRTTQINVRRSQVGAVIWVVMGVGAAILVLALVRRSVRRRRRAAEAAA